jgi:hypothetical protein
LCFFADSTPNLSLPRSKVGGFAEEASSDAAATAGEELGFSTGVK